MSNAPIIIQPRRFEPGKTVWLLLLLTALFAYSVYRTRKDNHGVTPHPVWTGETMGTTYSIRLADVSLDQRQLEELRNKVPLALEEVVRQMSHYRTDSEISRVNAARANEPLGISPDFAQVLAFALKVHQASGGAFDPTLGALINAWGFGPAGRDTSLPTESEIDKLRERCGAHFLKFVDATTVVKTVEGVELNLSAIAKGYGVDKVAQTLREAGISNGFVEIGGEVAAWGHNARGEPWRIGIELPVPGILPGEVVDSVVLLSNAAIATSGDYRNFRETAEGRRLGHILDPRTGYPVEHNVASVSVIARDCMTADALATAAFVLGEEDGVRFIETWPDVEAVFIVRTQTGEFYHRMTTGFSRYLSSPSKSKTFSSKTHSHP